MKREIKFRGKCLEDGELVYGDLIHGVGVKNGLSYILPAKINLAYIKNCDPLDGVNIDPDSISQFTGLKDKNGKEIYEGDILRRIPTDSWEETNYCAFEVFFHDNDHADNHIGWQFNRLHFHGAFGGYSMIENFLPKWTKCMIIIGNIYENPELLTPLKNR